MKCTKEKASCYGRVAVMVGAVVVLATLTTCRTPENEPAPMSEPPLEETTIDTPTPAP